MPQDSKSKQARDIHPLLRSSQTARHIVRLSAKSTSEYDLYDEYMSTVGRALFIPNPKRDVAENLDALREAGLVEGREGGTVQASRDAVRQVQATAFDDVTVELIESPGFRAIMAPGVEQFRFHLASCSTSTSCKCSSSSCSSSKGKAAELASAS
ncbi:MAG TPA: hypothetical protein VF547_05455 [Allosphingosinicella sp.]